MSSIFNPGAGSGVACFSVHKNGTDQTGVTSATFTDITWSTESFDVGGYFASNQWTPPAGKVFMSCAMLGNGTIAAGSFVALLLCKNGTGIRQVGGAAITNNAPVCMSLIEDANGSDVYKLQAFISTTSGTATINGGTVNTWWMGTLLP